MISFTITLKDILGSIGLILFVFTMLFGGFALILGSGHMGFINDLANGDKTAINSDLQNAKNMTAMHMSVHQKDLLHIIVSLYDIEIYVLPLMLFGVLFYLVLFTRYDDSQVRQLIKGLGEWLTRRGQKVND